RVEAPGGGQVTDGQVDDDHAVHGTSLSHGRGAGRSAPDPTDPAHAAKSSRPAAMTSAAAAGRQEELPEEGGPTMPTLQPCLWCDSEGLEAAEFYVSVFPRSEIAEVSRWSGAAPEREGTPLTVSFRLDGREFVALNGGPGRPFTEAVSLLVDCADQAEVDHYRERLLEGGGRESRCGWLTDRYGLSWQVVPTRLQELLSDPDPGRAKRAM